MNPVECAQVLSSSPPSSHRNFCFCIVKRKNILHLPPAEKVRFQPSCFFQPSSYQLIGFLQERAFKVNRGPPVSICVAGIIWFLYIIIYLYACLFFNCMLSVAIPTNFCQRAYHLFQLALANFGFVFSLKSSDHESFIA